MKRSVNRWRVAGSIALLSVGTLRFLDPVPVHAGTPPPTVDIWTWGANTQGQLGSVPLNQTVPSPIHEARDWVAVSAGSTHSIALTATGEVWAWGRNDRGQLGTGDAKDSLLPARVPGLAGITKISAGAFHNLAYRASDGALFVWGDNQVGQLAQPADVDHSALPIRVDIPSGPIDAGSRPLRAISAGGAHSLVVTEDGLVYAWGENTVGQLGTGDFQERRDPTLIALPHPAVAIASGGSHSTVALAPDGEVYAWGWNVFGQLGRGFDGTPQVGEPLPGKVLDVTDVVELSAGDLHNLARTSDGHVWVWGYNTEGQLGTGPPDPNTDNKPTPVMLGTIDLVTSIEAGGIFSLALRANGEVWAWGNGVFGAVGNNSRRDVRSPGRVVLPFRATAIAGGGRHAVALAEPRPSSRLSIVGAGGALGSFPTVRPAIRDAAGLTDVIQVSSGWRHTLVLDGAHHVWAFGDNSSNQLGVTGAGSDEPVSVDLPMGSAAGFIEVAARANQSFALRSDGALFAWGDGTWGQLGIGAALPKNPPTAVPVSDTVISVAAGERHALALDRDGKVWSWGQNLSGQLGTPPGDALVLAPQQVPGVVAPVLIAAGGYHSLSLSFAGVVSAWGSAIRGQLGSADFRDSYAPVNVAIPNDVVAVSAGRFHTVVVRAGGVLSAFGDNSECQIGSAPLSETLGPTPVPGYAVAAVAGEYHTLAMDYAGGIRGWGNDSGGQLGRNDALLTHSDCAPANVGAAPGATFGAGMAQSVIAVVPPLTEPDAGAP